MRSGKEINCYEGHTRRLFTLKNISFTKNKLFCHENYIVQTEGCLLYGKKSLRSSKKLQGE